MSINKKILIVEDEKIIAKVYFIILGKKGHHVSLASTALDAITKAEELNPDIILMDIHLNDKLTGVDIARQLRNDGLDCKIIFTTGNSLENTKVEIADIKNCSVLIKPVEFSEIEKLL